MFSILTRGNLKIKQLHNLSKKLKKKENNANLSFNNYYSFISNPNPLLDQAEWQSQFFTMALCLHFHS